MRNDIRFPYHTLGPDEKNGRFELIGPEIAKPVSDPANAQIGDVPQVLRQFGVEKVVLVHGTFAGNDIVGLTREIARFSPTLAGHLKEVGKKWFDDLVGELGNYTERFVDCCSSLINPASFDPIPVIRFHWSGENHHLGRANGMMSLLNLLALERAGGRVLIFAHSHGGNVVAMMSQLLAADVTVCRRFFAATRLHYRVPLLGKIDLPSWQQARERLLNENSQAFPLIDVATFGTPLRYRWNTDVCPNQLHFIQHRPLDPEHPERASFPSSLQDVIDANGGDYVQQIGIAGTDFSPSVFAWRDVLVEWRMQRMFERGARRRDVFKKLKQGRRVSCDGTTLLVDYSDTDDGWSRKLFGHGVYTCCQWLPFHLQEITSHFYGAAAERTSRSSPHS
jgi:hypothetical protein